MSNGSNEFCSPKLTESYPKWTSWSFIRWKFLPDKLGGGNAYLLAYKDSWLIFNSLRIQGAAKSSKIPLYLLAGVAWIEVGGMPDLIDSIAFPVRSFDWSGQKYIDKHLTITKNPQTTSFGSVSIQLRHAAKAIGVNINNLSYKRQVQLSICLETDTFNLNVVARHLHELIKHDFPDADSENLTDEQMIVVGSRYNRGTERKLEDFIDSLRAAPGSENRKYTEYGRTILRRRDHIRNLLFMRGR